MARIEEMMKTHPMREMMKGTPMLMDCLEACVECAETCLSCADACLAEQDTQMLKRCIRLNEDCADICGTCARILTRQTETDWMLVRDMLRVVQTAARLCGEECDRHADMHEHCRICADACNRCEASCRQAMDALPLAA